MAYRGATIFIDGETYPLPLEDTSNLAEVLCGEITIDREALRSILKTAAISRFITGLIRSGFFYPID